jgi:hypothetical protein
VNNLHIPYGYEPEIASIKLKKMCIIFVMGNFSILKLHLEAPLYFKRTEALDPFGYDPIRGEAVFHFAVNPAQCRSIEPDAETYLGELLGAGVVAEAAVPGAEGLELERDTYLFTQIRALPNREEIIDMAVEVQKEGLWEEYPMAPGFYLRYVFEEGAPVTQIFRRIGEKPAG